MVHSGVEYRQHPSMGSVIGTAASGVGGLVGNVISSPFNGVSCEYVRLKTTKSGVLLRRLPLLVTCY